MNKKLDISLHHNNCSTPIGMNSVLFNNEMHIQGNQVY